MTRHRVFRRRALAFWWLGLVVLLAVLAPALPLPYPPEVPDLAHLSQAPFGPGRHWLGTDPQGRDVLSILIFGARTAVLLTLPAALLAAAIGALAGSTAGFWGNTARLGMGYWVLMAGALWWFFGLPCPQLGLVLATMGVIAALLSALSQWAVPTWPVPLNSLVMGAATTLDTVPRLVLVVALAAGTGVSATNLLLILALTSWPHPARLVRAQMLRVRELPFITAAQAVGLPQWRIWLKHAMPHAISPLRTAIPLSLAGLLGLESTLSFLGIGLAPEVASWGRLMGTVRSEPTAWWTLAFPALMLVFSILSLASIGKSLSDES